MSWKSREKLLLRFSCLRNVCFGFPDGARPAHVSIVLAPVREEVLHEALGGWQIRLNAEDLLAAPLRLEHHDMGVMTEFDDVLPLLEERCQIFGTDPDTRNYQDVHDAPRKNLTIYYVK